MSKNTEMQVYLAGPFFNEAEIRNIEYAESILTKRGFSFFSPMRHDADAEPGTGEWAKQLFEMDVKEIQRADLILALYYGASGDTGTAWECGYAAAIGKPVILVHVKEAGDSNLMMHCGCTSNIRLAELETYDFRTMPVYAFQGKMY